MEKITVSRNEEGRAKVEITYRFGPPVGNDSAPGSQNSEEFKQAHGKGGGSDLMRGRAQMGSYDVAVERAPENV
ncbi:MAG: hypothetical protein M3R38_29200 [Actinomycetota bacterium]|nr:hypothetical protein [Actinomycetota bacterium]